MRMEYGCISWRSFQVILSILSFHSLVLSQCPIAEDGALFVRAPLGNLLIDTSASGFVEVEVSNSAIEVIENCFDDHVEVGGTAPVQFFGPLDWRILVPATVDLDLITLAGGVRVSSTEGNVTLRTTGGSVVTGNIGGTAAMITQGGSILVGNIGGNAELRSLGGQIEIGDVVGNAELETLGGAITTGTIVGQVRAETAGGTIRISESQGDLNAVTLAGDIVIGTASRTIAQTAGGNIIGLLIQGPFQGFTELGNIRLDHVEASVDATSGMGDIQVRLVPTSFEGDLHVTLRASSGKIRLDIPETLPADIEAVVDRLIVLEQRIRSDFPLRNVGSNDNNTTFGQRFIVAPVIRKTTVLNGGGNPIKVQTSRGTIEIRRIPQ